MADAPTAPTDEAPPPPLDEEPPPPAGAADVGNIDLEKVRRYRTLREAQAASQAEADAMKEEANALEGELIDMFTEAGLQNLNVDGKTVYLRRSVYAQRCEGMDAEDVKRALKEAGAGDLVQETVNHQTLSAYIRELTEDDDAPGLPEPLIGVIQPFEKYNIGLIAGGSKAKSKTHSK